MAHVYAVGSAVRLSVAAAAMQVLLQPKTGWLGFHSVRGSLQTPVTPGACSVVFQASIVLRKSGVRTMQETAFAARQCRMLWQHRCMPTSALGQYINSQHRVSRVSVIVV